MDVLRFPLEPESKRVLLREANQQLFVVNLLLVILRQLFNRLVDVDLQLRMVLLPKRNEVQEPLDVDSEVVVVHRCYLRPLLEVLFALGLRDVTGVPIHASDVAELVKSKG